MAELPEPLDPSANPRPERASVLLVDDTPANLVALRAILDDLGQHLVEARSGEEALRQITAQEFAVVLLDVRMPGLSGFDTAKLIRADERSRSTPIIFLTADDIGRDEVEAGYALGAVDFFVKPLSPVAVQAKVRGFVTLFREKQRARHEAEQLRLLVHGTTDYAIFMLDPQGRVATWNAGAERLKGYKAHEIIGQHFSKFYPQEVIDRGWPAHELKVAAAEGRFEDEGWRVRKDGTQFWANVVITALKDERGNLLGFSKITRDLTERKQAEENARRLAEESAARRMAHEERERLRVTLASIGDAVISTDAQSRVEFLNPVAEALVGWRSGEAAGRALEDVFRIVNENTRQPVENPALRALKEGVIVGLANHTVLISKDGRERPIDDSAAPIRSEQGHVSGCVLVFRDVTERRRGETVLAGQKRALELLIHGEPLPDVLDALCEVIEAQAQDRVIATVLLVDEDGKRLRSVAGRRAPPDYARAVDGIPIGPRVGSCGTAAFRGEPVVVTDIAADPLWADFRELALTHGLRACWSTPIHASHGGVLGTFAVYYPTPRSPSEEERRLVGILTSTASVAVERRRDEAALRASEARFRGLMEQAPFSVQVFAPDGRTVRVNRAWEDLWGVTLDQIADYNILEDRQLEARGVLPLVHRAFAGEPTFIPAVRYDPDETVPGRTRHADPVRWVAAVAYPLKDDAGAVREVVLVHDDITARRQAEAALREGEERLRLALDAGRMGVWDWNVRTGDLKWSDSLEPLHGLAPGTFGGTFEHFQRLIHPDDREAVSAAIRQALEGGGEFSVEFRNVWPNGGAHWIAGSGKVFPGDDGRPLRMIGVGMDVTARKRAEQTARFLADASAALAVLVDFDSTLKKVASLAVPHFADWAAVDVLEVNGNLRRVAVAHVDPAKVQLAHDLHRRFPPDPSTPSGVWNILRTGQAETVPVITDDMLVDSIKDGELLDIMRELGLKSYIGVPLTVRGKTLGVLTFIVAESDHVYDETDLAVAKDLANRAAIAVENSQLYRELREADRRKDEFLAVLAHELRNPLAPIRNGLQVLRLAGGGGEMVAEARSMMERQLGHMVRLVDDLLDVSRITRNKLELRKERVSLATVIHGAVETSRPLIEQSGHTLSVTLTPIPVYLDADPVRLPQVSATLLTNAAKYTEPGGRITLTAEAHGAEAVVRVRDTGLGIPAEALPRIFEMFSQVDRNLERAQGGLGIGLTLVRRLTEMHGGAVEATSEGPGRGSEFVVRLPVPRHGHQRSADREPGPDSVTGPRRRILVVDDNRDAAESLGMVLTLMGNEVRTAADGLAAVEVAEEYRPDLILLDIGLPKLNGYEACRRIRERPWSEGVVIVALTGWGQADDRRRSHEAGFDHHLVKPVDVTDLTKQLAQGKR